MTEDKPNIWTQLAIQNQRPYTRDLTLRLAAEVILERIDCHDNCASRESASYKRWLGYINDEVLRQGMSVPGDALQRSVFLSGILHSAAQEMVIHAMEIEAPSTYYKEMPAQELDRMLREKIGRVLEILKQPKQPQRY